MIENKQGFTLIELLTSITILSIILLVFFGFFSQGISFSTKTAEKQTAVHLAKQTLQEVKDSGDSLSFDENGILELSEIELNNIVYERRVLLCEEGDPNDSEDESACIVEFYEMPSGLQPVRIEIMDIDGNTETITFGYVEVGGSDS